MSAPATQTAAPVKMAMTAPVTQQTSVPSGGGLIQLVLPKGMTLASAPDPEDDEVPRLLVSLQSPRD